MVHYYIAHLFVLVKSSSLWWIYFWFVTEAINEENHIVNEYRALNFQRNFLSVNRRENDFSSCAYKSHN